MPSSKNDEIQLKLIDFGGAIKLENGQQTKLVDSDSLQTTKEYTAPEINVPRILNQADNGIMVRIYKNSIN